MSDREQQPAWHGYLLAFMIGVVLVPLSLLLDPRDEHLSVVMGWSALLYFFFGAVAGGMVPHGTWKVGLCVAAPLLGFVATSVYLVTGKAEYFGRDLPVILVSSVAAVAGGWAGSFLGSPGDKAGHA